MKPTSSKNDHSRMDADMNKLRISMLPAGDINAASSRLRCFFLGEQLSKLGVEVLINRHSEAADILFVQKRITKETLDAALRVKENGGLVIYDIDDYGPALEWLRIDPNIERLFLKLCDALIVDTPTRLEVFSDDPKYVGIRDKYVLADPVDYIPWRSQSNQAISGDRPPRGAWFGNAVNLAPAVPFIRELMSHGAVSGFDAITGQRQLEQLSRQFPMIGYKPWELKTFAATLQSYEFTVLIHDSNIEGVQKSNNKMLAAMALGVLPFVSNTPAYSETAAEAGLNELVVLSPLDLVQRVTSPDLLIDLQARLQGAHCQGYLSKFLPENVAIEFVQLLDQLLQKRLSNG